MVCISRSDEIKPGEVKSLKFCDNQVVAFRTESGEATVLDAFCPHLGAHLGEGGCVKGEHRVSFSCMALEQRWDLRRDTYAKNFPPKAKETQIYHYPTKEANGLFGRGTIY